MIHNITSSLSTFKSLEFQPGLNLLIAEKELGASDRQTRNRAGKTSLIEIVHYLTGASAGPKTIFRNSTLEKESFRMCFDLNGRTVEVERSGKAPGTVRLSDGQEIKNQSKGQPDWCGILGERMFGLAESKGPDRQPTFRSLYSYFVRRQSSSAFVTPEKQAAMQQVGDYQVALLYLLGLDWAIASDWQSVRDREKILTELKKAAKAGAICWQDIRFTDRTHRRQRPIDRTKTTDQNIPSLPTVSRT